MKKVQIVRKMDDLGRIVLPIELRRTLDIGDRDEVEIRLEDDHLVLKKYKPTCAFCSSPEALIAHMGKHVCSSCLEKMKNG